MYDNFMKYCWKIDFVNAFCNHLQHLLDTIQIFLDFILCKC